MKKKCSRETTWRSRVEHCSANKGSCRPHFFILALMLFSIWDIYLHASCFYEYSVDVTQLAFIFDARFATPLRSLSCTRKRTFPTSRIPYSVTGTSSFGDIRASPGPYRKGSSTAKYPCGDYQLVLVATLIAYC